MSFLGDKVANPIFQLVCTLDTHGTNKYISGGALSFSVCVTHHNFTDSC